MRAKPEGFTRIVAVQWLCAAVDQFLGLSALADIPPLLTGFGSVSDHAAGAPFARAAFSLRQLGVSYTSESDLRQAVYEFLTWEESRRQEDDSYVDQPFQINPKSRNISFRRTAGNDPRIVQWSDALAAGLPLREHGLAAADARRSFAVEPRQVGGRRITLDLSDVAQNLGVAPRHDSALRPRAPVTIPLADLQAIAERFDSIDAADANRASKGWSRRLWDAAGTVKVEVLQPAADRSQLEPVEYIQLDGLKHMIGLPGTGKTTLVTLLVAWFYERSLRTVVLLPSIEVSFNLMSELYSYGIEVGLLMGQSAETRLRHARKLAERIGSLDEARGFGRTVPFADLMSVNCALAGFDDDYRPEQPFPHLDPPCANVVQARLKANGELRPTESVSLCPAASWCGRMKASRQLAERHVWLGHVMSLDTRLPPHFAEEHLRHLEMVARTADVVIADEADGIQSALDRQAVSEISISGAKSSYENRLLDDLLKPLALGENDRTGSNVADYASKATRFMDLNRALIRQLQDDRAPSGSRFLAEYDDAFVTGNRVAADLFRRGDRQTMTDAERAAEDERIGAIMAFWDGCVRQALFRSQDAAGLGERDFDLVRTAVALGKSEDEVQGAFRACVDALLDWISYPSHVQKAEAVELAREAMFGFVPPNPEHAKPRAVALFSFLVNVSSVVMQFLSLVPAQHAMMAEGVHKAPIFRDGISADSARLVPDAVTGRLAGVRFLFQQRGRRTSLSLHYVTFEGAPRLFLYRLHELLRHDGVSRGPNVLLTSATSFLLDSPSFHVPVGPDYVLRRVQSDEAWRDSRYLLRPISDPQDPSRALRFSGAPYDDRERILRAMVDHFVRGDNAALPALVADRFSGGRRVAFVVNGYEQVRLVKDHAMAVAERVGRRIVAVVDSVPEKNQGDYITAAQVERLGQRDDWDAVVFPMKALSRGVNIVFGGPLFRNSDLFDKAAIGTVAFLTRPHPAQESFDFVAGMVGRDSMNFDALRFPAHDSVTDLANALRAARRAALADVRRLLRHSIRVGTLGNLTDAFVADVMIDVIQTIGRSMRNGCKTRVLFVDAAWAPNSMHLRDPRPDGTRTSYLVAMQSILERLVNSGDAIHREVYDALYRPYLEPLSRCAGLIQRTAKAAEDA
ncbi:ATP-binding protein [Mesorhizobium sp.]|uniref:ATP-binding protein n=1 Tax=Mesorhizobium sp. TaxID=1871066 RepID=UPI0025DBD9C0|nr:ATP-binding protein [Mesorhizobium sp.]